ncbi:MAG: helix-turn-helix transcriptional regulator [Blastocatellia bacterium]|nr:helix-turn-helix transcriptional regulator [Blastocatellia bacterium]
MSRAKMKTKLNVINLLTEREREVLRLIAEGATSKEIGENLGISRKTADAHRNNIKRKLRVDTIAHLVQCAIVLGLVEPQCPKELF